MEYDWDENKNESNIKNHDSVSFEEAQTVWADPLAQEYADKNHSEVEERFIIIGHSDKVEF